MKTRSILIALTLTLLLAGIVYADHTITGQISEVNGNMVAAYTITDDPALNGISHVVVKGCLTAFTSSTGCPGEVSVGYDPSTGATGIKCDAGGSYTWTLTFAGELLTAELPQGATIKYGPYTSTYTVPVVTCEPQAVTVERFEFVNGAFEWDAVEDGLGYWIVNSAGQQVIRWTPAQSPGNWGFFQYRAWPWTRTLPAGIYSLMAEDVFGQTGEAARLKYDPARLKYDPAGR